MLMILIHLLIILIEDIINILIYIIISYFITLCILSLILYIKSHMLSLMYADISKLNNIHYKLAPLIIVYKYNKYPNDYNKKKSFG